MKIISQNVRGMNSIHKLDVVRNFVQDHKPDIMMIQEMKMEKGKVKSLKSFNNYGLMASSFEGASGGTLVMRKKSMFFGTLMDANKHFVAIKILNLSQGNDQYVVNIYAPNNKNARKKFWDSL